MLLLTPHGLSGRGRISAAPEAKIMESYVSRRRYDFKA
jgi:hypothetical protein